MLAQDTLKCWTNGGVAAEYSGHRHFSYATINTIQSGHNRFSYAIKCTKVTIKKQERLQTSEIMTYTNRICFSEEWVGFDFDSGYIT